jgi:hypothetical protein
MKSLTDKLSGRGFVVLNKGRVVSMGKILVGMKLFTLLAITTHAQGLVYFNTSAAPASKISTNTVAGGAAAGLTSGGGGQYYYALYSSPSATSVNGQTAAIAGSTNNNYVFNDAAWTLVGYGTNIAQAGKFVGVNQGANGTVVPGVAGGSNARFVVIGWSASIGTTIGAVQAWYNAGFPAADGWIGQSAVSPSLTLGDGGFVPAPSLFGSGLLSGFVLGRVDYVLSQPPWLVTIQPTNQMVSVGGSATFTVTAIGDYYLPFTYQQWKFNGSNIYNGGSYQVSSSDSYIGYGAGSGYHYGTFVLTVTNAQATNAGYYSFMVSNAAGSAPSDNAFLTVTGISGTLPSVTTQPAAQSVGAGSNVTFSVFVSGSTPLSYQWTFNGTNLANAIGASLTLSNVQPANAGNYAVTITNAYGVTNSIPAALTVLTFPPIITVPPASAIVQIGNSVTFTVAASGTAPLGYQWQFNGTNLSGATSASYFIANAQTNLTGSYSVTVSNPYGTTNSASATLTVFPPSGYVVFANNNNSATKIFTNSDVGGPLTGLTTTSGGKYFYALFASTTATNVNGQTGVTLGNAGEYAFNDPAWTLVAYGTNTFRAGRLASTSPVLGGQTAVVGFSGGSTVQLVVVGWSANIGSDITAVQNWYGSGDPAFDGWIGESAVSGAIYLGDGGLIPSLPAFSAVPPG